jgi:hypothetical protein
VVEFFPEEKTGRIAEAMGSVVFSPAFS